MNKRYIDFVPVKKGEVDLKGSPFSGREIRSVARAKVPNVTKAGAASPGAFKAKKVRATGKDMLAKPVAKRPAVVAVEKPVEKSIRSHAVSNPKMAIPKNPFINTAKVVKRPLSKNIYRREVKTPAEQPKGPVTIISKSDKGAHVSLIVTIILTIVLGAAAGTVAFLLLPK